MSHTLSYDNTFEGFLSTVFYVFEYKLSKVKIVKEERFAQTFFDIPIIVETEDEKATRIWRWLAKEAGRGACNDLYRAYLSELEGIEDDLLYFIQAVAKTKDAKHLIKNFADPTILKISKVVRKVGREKHRMDAFVRFRETKDGLYVATVEPDFDVLPLITSHFEKRYADQKWLIYDLKRNYGIYYDLHKVETVKMEMDKNVNKASYSHLFFTENELAYQELWQNYFKSVDIVSRRNTKLHLQHVPKRYWKYLSEKQPFS